MATSPLKASRVATLLILATPALGLALPIAAYMSTSVRADATTTTTTREG